MSNFHLWCETWRKVRSLATYKAHSEDSDQTGRMPRLIWVFAGCTDQIVGFVIFSTLTDMRAMSLENLSLEICDQVRLKHACSATDPKLCLISLCHGKSHIAWKRSQSQIFFMVKNFEVAIPPAAVRVKIINTITMSVHIQLLPSEI